MKAAEVKEMWLDYYSPSAESTGGVPEGCTGYFGNTVASRDGQSVELVFEEAYGRKKIC